MLLLASCATLHAAPVTALAFSPDGKILAATAGNTLTLRDPATGDVKDSLTAGPGLRLTTLAFAPKGTLLAVGGGIPGEKGEVRLLDRHNKTWLETLTLGADLVTGLAFSPDGRHLAAATMEKFVHVYQINDTEPRLTETLVLKGHAGPVTAVAFSPDGKVIVSTSLDRSLKVWSAVDGASIRSLGQHTDAVHAIAFRPPSPERPDAPAFCVTGSDDRTVRVWQPTIGRMVRIVRAHSGSVLALACAPDGRSIYSAGQEGMIRQIDADSDTVLREWRASPEWSHSLAISPDGKTIVSGDWQGNVTITTADDVPAQK
jgi:WD40 repeat protein